MHFAVFSMSAGDKLILDEIEGLGNGYDQIHLDIPAFGECFSYIAQDAFIDESLLPYDWYKALVLAGARFHGFPANYVRRIESLASARDPDAKRRNEQWDIVGRAVEAVSPTRR